MRNVPTAVHRPARALVLAAMVAGGLSACQGGSAPAETAMNEELKRDLALAAGAGTELARPADEGRTRFVSAIERGEAMSAAPAPEARERAHAKSPRPSPRRTPETRVAARPRVAAEPTPEPQADAAVASPTPTVEVATAGPVNDAGATPAAEPAPAVTTVAAEPGNDEAPDPAPGAGRGVGSGGRGQGDGGWGWGGVVIRGGGIGDIDHCERDAPGRRMPGRGPGGILIGRRYPDVIRMGGMSGEIMRAGAGAVLRGSSAQGVMRAGSVSGIVLRGGSSSGRGGVLRGRQ